MLVERKLLPQVWRAVGTQCGAFLLSFLSYCVPTARCWADKSVFYQHFVPNGTFLSEK
jgi:hypothetical protein